MKYGFCIGDDYNKIDFVKSIGGDYVETGFNMLSRDPGSKYLIFARKLNETGIECESANCFIPGELKTVGKNIDYEEIAKYVEQGMCKAPEIGLKTVVFGSGGARSIPEDFSFGKAFEQLSFFLKEIAAPIADKYGVNIVVEPLFDCNIINTSKEGVMLAMSSGAKNVYGLVDLYHMYKTCDAISNIRDLKGHILHSHIAEPENRAFPSSVNEYDYKSFISALEYAGCPRCSVEAKTNDFYADAPVTAKLLKSL